MREIFSILCIVALAVCALAVLQPPARTRLAHKAQAADNTAGSVTVATNASGDVLLDSVMASLESHESISAKIRMQVRLSGSYLFGQGSYLQQGRGAGRQFRWDLAVQGAHGKSTLSQAGNQQRRWRYDDFRGEPGLQVIDIARVRAELGRSGDAQLNRSALDLTSGGLPQFCATLQRNFQFGEARQMQWQGTPVWISRGRWRADRLREILEAPHAAPADKGDVPAGLGMPRRMPHEVVFYADQQTLFPLRVEFHGPSATANSATARPVGPMAAMELFEVQFGIPIDQRRFARPEDVPEKDATEQLIKRLKGD